LYEYNKVSGEYSRFQSSCGKFITLSKGSKSWGRRGQELGLYAWGTLGGCGSATRFRNYGATSDYDDDAINWQLTATKATIKAQTHGTQKIHSQSFRNRGEHADDAAT